MSPLGLLWCIMRGRVVFSEIGLSNCHQIIRCFGFRRGFLRVNMRPSCVSHVQNVSPSPSRLTFDGKTRMFRCVFFNVFVCFLGVCFWGCCAYFPYLVGSVELFVVFFVFNLKYIGCLWNQISSKNILFWKSGYLIIIVVMIACFLFSIISPIYRGERVGVYHS